MGGSPLTFFACLAVFNYIVAPRCIYFVSGKVTSLPQTLVVTFLATLAIFFLYVLLKKKSR